VSRVGREITENELREMIVRRFPALAGKDFYIYLNVSTLAIYWDSESLPYEHLEIPDWEEIGSLKVKHKTNKSWWKFWT
jgi:hypothetical protein